MPGLVIRYAYLWRSDYLRGQEGVSDLSVGLTRCPSLGFLQ